MAYISYMPEILRSRPRCRFIAPCVTVHVAVGQEEMDQERF